jgi:hypothetical protein
MDGPSELCNLNVLCSWLLLCADVVIGALLPLCAGPDIHPHDAALPVESLCHGGPG